MATRTETTRRSFGIIGLVTVLLGYLGLLLGWGGLFIGGILIGGAIGAVDWRSAAGKVAVALAIIGLIILFITGVPGLGAG
jgi:hypothetical protein